MIVTPLHALAHARPQLRAGKHLMLFLDFDGTLAPIGDDPARTVLPSQTRDVLKALAKRDATTIAVVSGRPLTDIEGRVGVPGIIYGGNHGLEMKGPNIRFVEPRAAALQPATEALARKLAARLGNVRGVWVEDKGLSLSVHFRRAPSAEPEVRKVVRELLNEDGAFRANSALKVLEITARVDWHKGKAAAWLRASVAPPGAIFVCLGDDTSDEKVFAAIPDGVNIRVGDGSCSRASFFLAGPDEVAQFLRTLLRP